MPIIWYFKIESTTRLNDLMFEIHFSYILSFIKSVITSSVLDLIAKNLSDSHILKIYEIFKMLKMYTVWLKYTICSEIINQTWGKEKQCFNFFN